MLCKQGHVIVKKKNCQLISFPVIGQNSNDQMVVHCLFKTDLDMSLWIDHSVTKLDAEGENIGNLLPKRNFLFPTRAPLKTKCPPPPNPTSSTSSITLSEGCSSGFVHCFPVWYFLQPRIFTQVPKHGPQG